MEFDHKCHDFSPTKGLIHAASIGHDLCLSLIIKKNPNIYDAIIKNYGYNALYSALVHEHYECFKLLLNHCSLPNYINLQFEYCEDEHWACVHRATLNSVDAKYLKLLIEKGANIEEIDSDNRTALHRAAMCGNVQCAKLLIENDANQNALDLWQLKPIDLARRHDETECISFLESLIESNSTEIEESKN